MKCLWGTTYIYKYRRLDANNHGRGTPKHIWVYPRWPFSRNKNMDLWEQDLDFLFLNIWATIFEAGASRNVSRPAFLENPAKQLQDKHISALNRSPDRFLDQIWSNALHMCTVKSSTPRCKQKWCNSKMFKWRARLKIYAWHLHDYLFVSWSLPKRGFERMYLSYKPHGCAPQKERVLRLNRSIHPEGVFGWAPKASMLFCAKKTEWRRRPTNFTSNWENTRSNKMLSNHHVCPAPSFWNERPLKRNLSYEWSHVQIYIIVLYSLQSLADQPSRFLEDHPWWMSRALLAQSLRWFCHQDLREADPSVKEWWQFELPDVNQSVKVDSKIKNDSDLNFQPIKLYVKCWHILKS